MIRVLLLAVTFAFACDPESRAAMDDDAASDTPAASSSTQDRAASVAPRESTINSDSSLAALKLTPKMRQVLRDSLPNFAAWSLAHYAPEVRDGYQASERQAPWGVVGDFNEDGVPDLVLDGTDGRRDMRIVLLSTAASYRLVRLREQPIVNSEPSGAIEALVHRQPGTIQVLECEESGDCRRVPFELRAEAFEVVFWEKASELWYWNGEAFAVLVTSD